MPDLSEVVLHGVVILEQEPRSLARQTVHGTLQCVIAHRFICLSHGWQRFVIISHFCWHNRARRLQMHFNAESGVGAVAFIRDKSLGPRAAVLFHRDFLKLRRQVAGLYRDCWLLTALLRMQL